MSEKARQKLSATGLSIREIAYGLSFEHPQSFSKLFKSKASLSPLEFQARFTEPTPPYLGL
jgi:AraC family transcriptional regulator, transcriptional activator of pobA